jgi:hypothetical protein
MSRGSATGARVYRAGIHLYAVVGVFALLFVTMEVFIAVKRGDWTFFAVVVGGSVVLFLLLQVLRLEVSPDGFKYRNLSGTTQGIPTRHRASVRHRERLGQSFHGQRCGNRSECAHSK